MWRCLSNERINILNRNRCERTIIPPVPANTRNESQADEHSERNGKKNSFIMKLWQIVRGKNNSNRPKQDLLHPTATHFSLIHMRYVQAKLISNGKSDRAEPIVIYRSNGVRVCVCVLCVGVSFFGIFLIWINALPPRIYNHVIFFSSSLFSLVSIRTVFRV